MGCISVHRTGQACTKLPAMDFAHTVAMPPGELPPGRDTPGDDTPGQPGQAPGSLLPAQGHIGRYELKYRIGDGGAGTVYAARDPVLSRMIALKTLNLDLPPPDRPRIHALFLDEARAAAKLSHPHIVTVFDAGVGEQGPYIAMELLKGKDLREILFDMAVEGRRFSPVDAASVMRRVAEAIDYAHGRGIVHRDLKPANIFLTGRHKPKVLDFGIARLMRQRPAGGHTSIQPVAGGSPYYLAPELLDDAPGDPRSDIFSLGVVLYEMLTGEKPFQGDSLDGVFDAITRLQPPSPHERCPDVPPALSDIVMQALSKDPAQRPASAGVLARELRRFLHSADGESVPRTAAAPQATPGMMSRPLPWLLAGALCLAAAAIWLASPASAPGEAAEPAAMPGATSLAVPAEAPREAAPLAPTSATLGGEALPQPADAADAPPTASVARPAPETRPAAARPAPAPRPAAAPRPTNATAAAAPTPAVPSRSATVSLAVTPWGQVEVDGRPMGVTPPLTRLELPPGTHRIVIRNGDLPAHEQTVRVQPGETLTLRHRF